MKRNRLIAIGLSGIFILLVLLFSSGSPFTVLFAGETIVVDEGAYTNPDGKEYEFSFTTTLKQGENRFRIAIPTTGGMIISEDILITANFKTKTDYSRYSDSTASATLDYNGSQSVSGTIQTLYGYKQDRHYSYLKSEPLRYSSSTDNEIYIESADVQIFKKGCSYMDNYCYGDLRPPSSYNVPCVIAEKNYWSYKRKVWANSLGGQGETGQCDRSSRGVICYDTPIYASKEGGCKAIHGAKKRDSDDWSLTIFWTNYYYKNIFKLEATTGEVIIAFNIPDSDGDGISDPKDLAPYDASIAISLDIGEHLVLLQGQTNALEGELANKAAELRELESQRAELSAQFEELNITRMELKEILAQLADDKQVVINEIDVLELTWDELQEQLLQERRGEEPVGFIDWLKSIWYKIFGR